MGLKIGYHVSIAKSMDLAFDRAEALGCTAMQIFITNPRGWADRRLANDEKERFIEKQERTRIEVVAHMPYLPNIASSNSIIFKKSVNALKENLAKCNDLGIRYLVAHMGSHMGHGRKKGLDNIVEAISMAEQYMGSTKLLLENESGHINAVGADIDDLSYVYGKADSKKLGFCMDTCHLYAAGYDITRRSVLDTIDRKLGWDKVHAIHLNDSKKPLGSRLDRHDNIGYGHIGIDGFRKFLSYDKVTSKPLILETPSRQGLADDKELRDIKRIYESLS
ncbi:MAG: deoxyribonuclease IV [Candidatus Micrarchaeota archaeon]|nr:deoxyribonuclease IV [Candidatus Micrarchaeota archaeon]